MTRPLRAADAPARTKPSNYPEPFYSTVAGRRKQPLGDLFGLKNFGVNLTTMEPGGLSSIHHRHSRQDEFIYILEGTPTLVTDEGEFVLSPGMVSGFPAGGTAHHLHNRADSPCVYLEIGDRTPGDECSYPNDDLMAVSVDGTWTFTHKDGSPY
ncbi:cupin domain-containing protein [Consotaella aegiceratis]|uniref:cupin domain-containing protein n=1 Tax=Consotaella aegiceratis TaxID=3097961 RepID=UPI002F413A40